VIRLVTAVVSLVMLTSHAYAYPRSWCNGPGLGGIPMLDEIKRQFWRTYPADIAQVRTREAVQAFIDEAHGEWITSCCLPQYSLAQCQAAAERNISIVRQWDWRSPPRYQ
jgi:hypothetical protein